MYFQNEISSDAEHYYFNYYIPGDSSPIIFLFIFN